MAFESEDRLEGLFQHPDLVRNVLQLRIPKAYAQFIRNYPSRLLNIKRDMSWRQESPASREIVMDPWNIVQLNYGVRLPGTPWTIEDGPWPEQFFVIGDNQCGDYWVLDVTEPGTTVYFYDHDLGTFEKNHETIEEFAEWLIQDIENWNKEREGR